MKTVNFNNTFWLSGYFDDFHKPVGVADDKNSGATRTHDHTITHFGSILGGNNPFNPRFKHSYYDRLRSGSYHDGMTGGFGTGISDKAMIFTTTLDNRLTMNRGIHEWITVDNQNSDGQFTENQTYLFAPNSLCANRQRWNGVGNEGYLRFNNAHDTQGHYYAPTGTIDPYYGGSNVFTPRTNLGFSGANRNHQGGMTRIIQEVPNATQIHTHFAGIYTGEQAQAALDHSLTRPQKYLHNITSPSGQNFMINSLYDDRTATGTKRLLSYDGALRLRGLGEMFHLRIATHKIGDWDFSHYILKIGYKDSTTYDTTADDFADNSCIATLLLTGATLGIGNLDKWDGNTESAYNADEIWTDIFLQFDFNAGVWAAYANDDTTAFQNGLINPSVDMATAKGWSLDAEWLTNGSESCVVLDTLIDRAGVILPLNWRNGGVSFPPPIEALNFTSGIDKVSTLSVCILDDMNEYSLSALTTGSSASEWRLLMMNSDESRVLWSGFIDGVQHSQDKHGNLLKTTIDARDSLGTLDRILPVWETGQNAHTSLNQHISMDAINTKRNFETAQILSTMLFGANQLIVSENTLGFNAFNVGVGGTVDDTFIADPNSRTRKFSGQSIQMYIGEDEYGANEIEKEWEGGNNNFFGLLDVIGLQKVGSNWAIFVEYDPDIDGQPTFANLYDSSATITSHRGIGVGDSIELKGTNGSGAGYDGSYTVSALTVLRRVQRNQGGSTAYRNVNTKKYVVRIDTTTTYNGSADENLEISAVSRHYTNGNTSYSTVLTSTGKQEIDYANNFNDNKTEFPISLTIETSSAHNLEVGDWIMIPNGVSSNVYFCEPFQVIGVISSTKIHTVAPYDAIGASTVGFASLSIPLVKMSVYDANPNAIENRPAKVKPVIYKSSILTNSLLRRYMHRTIHARWLRDLPLSPYFRAQFGVIDAIPHWRTGHKTALQYMFSPNQMDAGIGSVSAGFNEINPDGSVMNWRGLDATYHASNPITPTTTELHFDDPAMWYYIKVNNMEDDGIILELLDKDTLDSQYVIGNVVSNPLGEADLSWDSATDTFTVTGLAGNINKGDIVIHEGFRDFDLNGVFRIHQMQGSTAYRAERVTFEPMIDEFAYVRSKFQGGSQWSAGSAHYFDDPDAIKINTKEIEFTPFYQLFSPNQIPISQTTGTPTVGGKIRYNKIIISGIKGIKKTYDPDRTIVSLRKIDESNGYKHCYVLWADMRNDGTANADGGLRKKEFGMILPTTENYKINVCIADQFDENGNPDVFTSLKIGEEVDLWQFDATAEPYYGVAWSALNGGSDYEPLDDRYHNWKDKGGSFIIIDASRFYNLNTMATGGRSGYSSGGLVDFGDYVLATKGFPYLTDAYYKAGIASYRNTQTINYTTPPTAFVGISAHKNSLYMLNDKTILVSDIALGAQNIDIDDHTLFNTSGTGAIICQTGENRSQEDLIYYFSWTGKTTTATGDRLTGVYITSIPAEQITDIETINTILESEKENLIATSSTVGSRANITLKDPDDETSTGVFKKVLVFNTPSAVFPLRLSVNIEGIIKSKNTGTYYVHDKMRSMFSLSCADTWATNTSLPCVYHIPKTRQMPKEIGSADTDSFGSTFDAKNTTILNMANEIVAKDGNGDTHQTTFNYLMDRDNIMTIRQKIPSGIALNRNNMLNSKMSSRLGSQITNVRVYYNGNSNFVDFPEPVSGTPTRWRTLNYENVFSRDEAMALAKQEFLRERDAQVSISAEILLTGTQKSKMLDGGRYGYVQDAFIRNYHYDRFSNASWTNIFGGFRYSGIQDYRHSNNVRFKHNTNPAEILLQAKDNYPSDPTGILGKTVITDPSAFDFSANGIHIRKSKFGFESTFDIGSAGQVRYGSGLLGTLQAGFNSIPNAGDTDRLTIFCDAGFTPPPTNQNGVSIIHVDTFGRSRGYPTYATKSLSQCVKVMYVEKDMPYVSETTGNELRLGITIDGGKTSPTSGFAQQPPDESTTFRLHVIDPVFDELPSGSLPPEYDATTGYASSVQIIGNGMYRVQVPTQYSSEARHITFDVDYDYLMGIVRRMNSDIEPLLLQQSEIGNNGNLFGTTYPDINKNEHSAFPLGISVDGFAGVQAEEIVRRYYYAPRIKIVDDLIYQPATTLTFTDTHIDLTSETLHISDITWKKNHQEIDTVSLNLERIAKHYSYGFAGLFKSITEGGGSPNKPPRPTPPPPTIPPVPVVPPLGGGGFIRPIGDLFSKARGADSSTQGFAGLSSNLLGSSDYRGLKGKANFANDVGLATGSFGVIGQNRPSASLSNDRDIDGIESSMMASEGTSTQTADGFILGGIIDADAGAQGETHSNSINVRVPNDISEGGFVSVDAVVTFGGDTSSIAELATTILCAETSDQFTQTTRIQGNTLDGETLRRTVNLVNPVAINGSNVAGNTIKVTISRSPAQGQDNAGFSSVVIHSISVKMRRYSNSGNAQSNNFKPY